MLCFIATVLTVLTLPQTNGIFELRLKNAEGKEGIWTIDLKTTGSVYKGASKSKPNVTILMSDETFQDLASGKVCRVQTTALCDD